MRKSALSFATLRSRSGFTLVELLVVISIIAILSVIGLVIFSGVQKNTRNAKRIADMKAIALALEQYYNDPVNNFTYPCSGTMVGPSCTSPVRKTECNIPGHTQVPSPNDVIPELKGKYLADPFPSDPGMNKAAGTSCYIYYSNGKDYVLIDRSVSENSSDDYKKYPTFLDPVRDGVADCILDLSNNAVYFAWKVYSFNVSPWGGKCW